MCDWHKAEGMVLVPMSTKRGCEVPKADHRCTGNVFQKETIDPLANLYLYIAIKSTPGRDGRIFEYKRSEGIVMYR